MTLTGLQWDGWAYKYPDGIYRHFGSYEYVKVHGLPEPMVQVRLTVDPTGTYFGWVENGKLIATLVWSTDGQFEMQFPYGSAVAEENREGAKVRLIVEELSNDDA